MAKPNKQAALSFIFITLLIDVTGLGIIIPVLPKLIQTLIHGGLSEASRYAGLLTVAYSIAQFIFSPIIGNLSDKYGRRPVLLGWMCSASLVFVSAHRIFKYPYY